MGNEGTATFCMAKTLQLVYVKLRQQIQFANSNNNNEIKNKNGSN